MPIGWQNKRQSLDRRALPAAGRASGKNPKAASYSPASSGSISKTRLMSNLWFLELGLSPAVFSVHRQDVFRRDIGLE